MRDKRYNSRYFCNLGNDVIIDRQAKDMGVKQESVIEIDASRKGRGVWTGHG